LKFLLDTNMAISLEDPTRTVAPMNSHAILG